MQATPDWLIHWQGHATLAHAKAVLDRHGFVAVLAGVDATGLPPPLPQEQQEARARHHHHGFLVRRAIARALAAAASGDMAAQDMPITRGENGAPRFGRGGLHVSFSARGALGAIALGRAPLGIDYEAVLSPGGVPWNLLRNDERAMLSALPPGQQTGAFLALWRAKEAALKAAGCGFALPPEAVLVEGDQAKIPALSRVFHLHEARQACVTLAVCNNP